MTRTEDCHWYAIHVRHRYEKAVSEALTGKDIEHFLPLYRSKRTWGRSRQVSIDLPLFPAYLFVRLSLSRRLDVLTNPGVLRIVSYGDAPARVDDAEIASLKTVVHSGLEIEPSSYVNVGDTVEVIEGPLTGVRGPLLARQMDAWVAVSISLLNRSVVAKVDPRSVRPIDRHSCLKRTA